MRDRKHLDIRHLASLTNNNDEELSRNVSFNHYEYSRYLRSMLLTIDNQYFLFFSFFDRRFHFCYVNFGGEAIHEIKDKNGRT